MSSVTDSTRFYSSSISVTVDGPAAVTASPAAAFFFLFDFCFFFEEVDGFGDGAVSGVTVVAVVAVLLAILAAASKEVSEES